jgi:anaerobic magnesium-protoporphyrin IX monomethyl ester cyclase
MARYNKVALAMCPCWGRESPPLSIALLGGNLRSKGYETHLFDLSNYFYHQASNDYKNFWGQDYYSFWSDALLVKEFMNQHKDAVKDAVNMILDTGCQIIGFSTVFTTLHFSLELAEFIKQRCPDSIIIMGGPHTSLFYAGMYIINQKNVDAIILHEGDETLPQALQDLSTQGQFSKIPGLVFKKDGHIIDGGMREPIHSLNDLSLADYTDFDLSTYSNPNRLDIFSSRSCINHCHYCDERNYFKRYRFRSGKNLYDEIIYQLTKNPSVNFFNFSDSVLNGSIEAIREFCELLIRNHINIQWGGQAVIRKEMTPELLQLMHKAGCSYLSYGQESGSNKVLESMNKKLFTVELSSVVLKASHEAKINTYANFMFGYPTETETDFLKTLEFIKKNRKWLDAVSPSQSFTIIVKNTYLYDHLSEFNIAPEPHHLYWKTIDGKNTYPVRFKRYELFCTLCIDLGLKGVGVVSEKTDKWRLLGEYYYEHEKDYGNALECYRTDLLKNGYLPKSLERFVACSKALDKVEEGQAFIGIFELDKVHPKESVGREGHNQGDSPLDHTDENWLNGVARSWATAFFVANSTYARKELVVGAKITFADGTARKIVNTKEDGSSLMVFLDGAPLDGAIVGYPQKFTIHSGWIEERFEVLYKFLGNISRSYRKGMTRLLFLGSRFFR